MRGKAFITDPTSRWHRLVFLHRTESGSQLTGRQESGRQGQLSQTGFSHQAHKSSYFILLVVNCILWSK